ncbi:MAG: hypothetical protein AMXMBFR85_11520 [Dehalococcoides mccartyi]
MSRFHSSLSRRDFMKALGITGAGIGTAAAASTTFKDIDGMITSGAAPKKPWWVKEADKATVEFDWSQIERFDARKVMNSPMGPPQWVSTEEWANVEKVAADNQANWIKEGKPGYTLRDHALYRGAMGGEGSPGVTSYTWLGPQKSPTPEKLGTTAWQGTPEENTAMLRSALRFFGAADIGVVELDENVKKLVYTYPRVAPYKRYEFEAVDKGYEDDEKWVIPSTKKLYVVSIVSQSSIDGYTTTPSWIQRAASDNTVRLNSGILAATQEFLRTLGYQGLAGHERNAIGPAPAFATLAGLGELCRNTQVLTPDYGLMVRSVRLITDLPLAPTKPIDAGIWRFCHDCAKCAEACVSQAIPHDKEPSWEIPGGWNNPGKKVWYVNAVKCQSTREMLTRDCGLCMTACVYTKKDYAGIHKVVKGTISSTGVFNSFFKNMDDFFGYGTEFGPNYNPLLGNFNENADDFWTSPIPQFGVNSMIGLQNR